MSNIKTFGYIICLIWMLGITRQELNLEALNFPYNSIEDLQDLQEGRDKQPMYSQNEAEYDKAYDSLASDPRNHDLSNEYVNVDKRFETLDHFMGPNLQDEVAIPRNYMETSNLNDVPLSSPTNMEQTLDFIGNNVNNNDLMYNMLYENLYNSGNNRNVMRDEEHLQQSGLWGPQYIQGGYGEGLNISGYPNIQEIKTDAFLPTYCDPPNPCPVGYTSDDNCLEGVKNTADFSRLYQSQQDCLCDPEHMFDCPVNRIDNTLFLSDLGGNPYKNLGHMAKILKNFESKRKNHPIVAKKGKPMSYYQVPNPHLMGEKLRTVAKKGNIQYF